MKIQFAASLLALASAAMTGQAFADDNQVWATASANARAGQDKRILMSLDLQARFREDASELGGTVFRPAVGWRASDKLDLYVGYGLTTTERETGDIRERQVWQQAAYPVATVLGGALKGKTRLEERFRRQGADTGWRVRQQFKWTRPFEGSPFALVASEEAFVALNDADWGQTSGFDQNRALVGVSATVARGRRIEVGYMNIHLENGPAPSSTLHVLSLTTSLSF